MEARESSGQPGSLGAGTSSFVVVANRLPVDVDFAPDGTPSVKPAPGGLVAALTPILEKHRGSWVGWAGNIGPAPAALTTATGVRLHPVGLAESDYELFYEGFSNATLWPLYHDLIARPTFERSWWTAYREVNERFARAAANVAAQGATIWVQDYQLQLVPGILRQLRPDVTIGFFLHIPFPSPDLFRQLPWREEVIRGLLGADLIGFHLTRCAQNFLELTRQVSAAGSHIGLPDTLEVSGAPSVRAVTAAITAPDGRRVGVGAFPISIDLGSFTRPPAESVAALRRQLGDPNVLMLGVDRLDYTKGILQRLLAIEELLASAALPHVRFSVLQVATPSRERLADYRRARSEVEEAVGRINGRFGAPGRPVVEYLHRSVPKEELAVYYAAADVMLVTPFKDGMNLVAKEFVAAHPESGGALVLSEFAGAAEELTQAYLCNPFDLDSIKRAIHQTVSDLTHRPQAVHSRMAAMHAQVLAHDVDKWAQSFLQNLHPRRPTPTDDPGPAL
ncbi:alpha,alpha-trehalose-phosphate synthase (UDP-forming) [Corynebacterium atypicum]|uniref:alpha,alpha-trehalose-phosphate synthase (UDP-forming) n=1 Tax=Corynebacterium atypicum TaxID=191610 RepID=UPI0006894045|nr:trehalose-6-phosphate synthase [Corynebacterium atypicum]